MIYAAPPAPSSRKVSSRGICSEWLKGSLVSMSDFTEAKQMQGYWVEQKPSSMRKSSIFFFSFSQVS